MKFFAGSGIFPCVRFTSLKEDVYYGKKCHFRHREAEERQQQEVEERVERKDQLAILKESMQLGCVSQDSYPV